MTDQCPATTRVTPPRSIEVFSLQCRFAKGHDGDHCAPASWSFAQGDVFWPPETMADDAVSDEDRIRDAMAEAQDHPGAADHGRIVTMTTLGEVAYLAWWREHEHGHGYDHDAWLGLPQRQRNAWEAAARTAAASAITADDAVSDEDRIRDAMAEAQDHPGAAPSPGNPQCSGSGH